MMKFRTAFSLALLALTLTSQAYAMRRHGGVATQQITSGDPTINVLPSYNDTYANWSVAGLLSIGGIPTRSTQCGATLTPSGADDASAINAAITACAPGDYVLLGAGTTSNITASISGNTLTVTAGSGEAIGDVIGDAAGKLMPNTTITAGSGSSWTVNITQTVASQAMWTVVPFKVTQTDHISLNKGVTLRGSGSPIASCSQTCWPTVISVTNGAIPDWSISPTTAGALCGSSSASATGCSGSTSVILMSPSGLYDWGWGGCAIGQSAVPSISNCGTLLSADSAKGDTRVQVTSVANLSVGQWVLIDEDPQASFVANPVGNGQEPVEASADLTNSSGSPVTMRLEGGDIPGGYSFIGVGSGYSFVSAPPAGMGTAYPNLTANWTGPDGGHVIILGGTHQQVLAVFTNGSNLVTCIYGSSNCPTITGSPTAAFNMATQRLNAELHYIVGIGSSQCPGGTALTVCFDAPLTMAFRQSGSHDARLYWPTLQNGTTANPFLTQAGVENLTLLGVSDGGVNSYFCAYCWVKNVEVSGWFAGGFSCIYCVRNDVQSNYYYDCFDCENNGNEYPISINEASTEVLVANSIFVHSGKGMVGRAANTAVFAYNYQDETMYMQSVLGDWWVEMGLNGSHYAGTHHFLFEGNWGDNCDNDNTHGNAIYHTYFRNQCSGLRTTFTDFSSGSIVNDSTGSCWGQAPSPPAVTCGTLRAVGPMAYDYWLAYVANVLGSSGQTTTANGWAYNCASVYPNTLPSKCIWLSGWNASGFSYAPDPNLLATASPQYLFKHGNYDYVNASIADWSAGYSHTLPNSFYLKNQTAPSWWPSPGTCTYPWPWVTPTGGSPLQANSCSGSGLPAKARFDAGTPFVQP